MNELVEIHPDIEVREEEYKRLLGYPANYELEGRALELAEWARAWYNENGKPWIYTLKADKANLSGDKLKIDGIDFLSKKLHDNFSEAEADDAVLAAVSAGRECEEKARSLWVEGKPDEYFFLEVYGSAVVEHLITAAGARLCAWADSENKAVLPHYSPGYTGWNIEDQNRLMELIFLKSNGSLPGRLEIFESGMLNPKKSMLALFGITSRLDKVRDIKELIPCESCSLKSCQYRRKPYRHHRSQVEDVHQLQGKSRVENFYSSSNDGNGYSAFPLTIDAKYSVSIKALKKWSQERLKLKINEDNSVEAVFRYEGTTCSNMGRVLEFDYKLKLSSPSENYKIEHAACRPAPGDDGFTYMCEFINDPDSIMNSIKTEAPLFGKPLEEILKWERQFSPEGCYCEQESRDHKWGIALEVLHFALAENEKNKN